MNSRTRRYLPDLARIAALLLLTSAAQGADPTASIETAVVRRLPMDIRLESYGTLQPDPDALASINLPRAGVVNRLLVRLGQRVKAGDTLLEIDTAPATRMAIMPVKRTEELPPVTCNFICLVMARNMPSTVSFRKAGRSLSPKIKPSARA